MGFRETVILKQLITISVASVLGISCASTRAPERLIKESPPAQPISPKWVDTPPNDPDYFYGVGAASATGDPTEDRKKADDAARIDIASQLKIKISSVVLSIMQYTQKHIGGKSQEQWSGHYSERMAAVVDTTALEGVKIIDRWHDPKSDVYYSLASMSVSEFRERVRKKIEKAENLALDQYYHAQEAEGLSAIPTALKFYANALAELQVIEDIPFEVDLDNDGTKEYFRPEVKRKIRGIVRNLDISPINNNQKTKFGKPLQKPLIVKVLYRGTAAQDIPIMFTFVRGKGQLDKNALTNFAGKASSKVYKAESVGANVVEAKINLTKMMGPGMTESLGLIEIPKARLTFSTEAIAVMVRISEENLGQPVADSFVEEAVVENLADSGFMVVPKTKVKKVLRLLDIEKAMNGNYTAARAAGKGLGVDIVVIGRASTKFSRHVMKGVESCRARAIVKAIDVHSGNVLAAKDVSEVKGFADTKEKAGIRALKKASEQIANQIVEQLKTSL